MYRLARLPCFVLVISGASACGSGAAPAQNSTLVVGDAGIVLVVGPQQETEKCPSDGTMCLYGTAQPAGYVASPMSMRVTLYRVFPSFAGNGGAPVPVAAQIVARDDTWAFSSNKEGGPLEAWGHYFVEVVPLFSVKQMRAVATRVGPLALPGAGPVAIQVKPVQFDLLEQSAAGSGPMTVASATAHVFDTTSGDDIGSGASVSLLIGNTPTNLAWDTMAPGSPGYFLRFQNPPPAQASYEFTAIAPGAGSAPIRGTLVASPPGFTGAITSPAAKAVVSANKALAVTWPVQADADYEVVQLFRWQSGAWSPVYGSPNLNPPDVFSESIPANAVMTPGAYLLNVAFTRSNCPPTGDGCVHASTVAYEELTVQ